MELKSLHSLTYFILPQHTVPKAVSKSLHDPSKIMEQFKQLVQEIDANGDITLEVGSERLAMTVNSSILKSASPVFAAMLSTNFKEGNELAQRCGSPTCPSTPSRRRSLRLM